MKWTQEQDVTESGTTASFQAAVPRVAVEMQEWMFVEHLLGASGLSLPQPWLVGSQGEGLARESGCLGSNLSPAAHQRAGFGKSLHVFVPWFSHPYKGLSSSHSAGPAEQNLPRPGGGCGVLAPRHGRKSMREAGRGGRSGHLQPVDFEVALTR